MNTLLQSAASCAYRQIFNLAGVIYSGFQNGRPPLDPAFSTSIREIMTIIIVNTANMLMVVFDSGLNNSSTIRVTMYAPIITAIAGIIFFLFFQS